MTISEEETLSTSWESPVTADVTIKTNERV